MKQTRLLTALSIVLVVSLLVGGNTNLLNAATPTPAAAKFSIAGAPVNITPALVAGNGNAAMCSLPAGCDVLAEPGVISVNTQVEADTNPSAILISPDTQSSLWGKEATLLVPEAGYMMVSGAGFKVVGNKLAVELTPTKSHVWFLVVRGILDDGTAEDRSVPIAFSGYNPGAVLVTRFPVPADAGQFFSQDYLQQNVDAAYVGKNCGMGCDSASVFILDLNNSAWSVMDHAKGDGWTVRKTNVAGVAAAPAATATIAAPPVATPDAGAPVAAG